MVSFYPGPRWLAVLFPGSRPYAAFGGRSGCLLGDLINLFAGAVLGGHDLLTALAIENAHEAADRVLLLAGGFHDLGERHPLGAFSQGRKLEVWIPIIVARRLSNIPGVIPFSGSVPSRRVGLLHLQPWP